MDAGLSIPAAVTAWLKDVRVYNVESIVRFVRPSLTAGVLWPFSDVTVPQGGAATHSPGWTCLWAYIRAA